MHKPYAGANNKIIRYKMFLNILKIKKRRDEWLRENFRTLKRGGKKKGITKGTDHAGVKSE